jgi:non-specific serine/threonine protein kinase
VSLDEDRIVAALPAYDIGEELGRGSWGIVLAGVHRQLGRAVAIKQLPREFGTDPAVRRRFLAEGRLLASLDHPHIVPIYDFVENDGVCLFVMERLTGGTLWSRFKRDGLTYEGSCAAILGTCSALHYAHSHGVLHRDVKPHNLMLTGEGVLKVTDFGIAKVVGGSETVATRAGQILGTPAYMAPEQAQSGELTPRTDVYATGMILYELLSGELAFPEDSDPIAMLFRHVHEDPRPLTEVAPAVPEAIAVATMRAIQRDPDDRYATTEEFGVAVARAAAGAWGSGWLGRSEIGVVTGGHIRAAAVDEQARSIPPAGSAVSAPPDPLLDDRPTLPPASLPPPSVPPVSVPPVSVPPVSVPPVSVPPVSLPPAAAFDPSDSPTLAPPWAPSAPPAAAASPPPPRRGRRRLLFAGVPVLALVVASAAFLATRQGGGTSSSSADFQLASQWRAIRDAPTARQQMGAATLDGVVWVAGGLTGSDATAKVDGYDPAIDNWKPAPDLPVRLHHASAVAWRNQLVVIGGWIPEGPNLTAIVSEKAFVLRGSQWAELPRLTHPRAAAAAAVVGDKIVVVGGQAEGDLVAPTEVFDGLKWTDAAPIPTRREHLAAASDGEVVYAVGGRVLSNEKNLPTLERFEPGANKWKTLPDMPTARGGLGAAVVKNRLFAVGGEDPVGTFNAVEAYDIKGHAWNSQPVLNSARHGLGVASIGDDLYAIGGARAPGHTDAVAISEVLSPTRAPTTPAGQWQTLHDAPTARQQLAAAEDHGSVWVVGGILGDKATAKAESYDPVVDKWKAGPSLPVQVHHASAASYKGELVVLGGWIPDGPNLTATISDRVFALRNGQWVDLPRLTHPRAAAAAAVVGDRLVVVGGQADGQLVPATEVFDGDHWHDAAAMPTLREHVAAASDGKFVYVVGGRDLSPSKNFGKLERYDPAADTWQKLPDMPTARGGLGATVVNGRLVVVGGEAPEAAFQAVEAYDISAQSWAPLTSLLSPTHGMGVVGIGKSVYIVGGARRPGHKDSTAAAEALAV